MRAAALQAGKVLMLIALGALPILVHAGLIMGQSALTPVLSALQLLGIGVFVLLLFAAGLRWLAVGAIAGLGAVALWARSAQLGAVAATGTVHAVVYTGLLVVFGSTLLPGREALVTMLARKMHATVPDDMAAYTRGVTWAWTLFFAGQLAGSLALLLFAPLADWSLFVNVLNFPLLVLMFAGESCYRTIGLANRPRYNFADMLAIWGHIKASFSGASKSGG
jgi:uncharacterized membrane protein